MSTTDQPPETPSPSASRRRLAAEQRRLTDQLAFLQSEIERKFEELRVMERDVTTMRRHRADVRAFLRDQDAARARSLGDQRPTQPTDALQPQQVTASGNGVGPSSSTDGGPLVRVADTTSITKECSEVDPEKAQNAAEFIQAMNMLKVWSGLSLRKLEERAGPGKLPHSSLAAALNRDRLPDPALLRTFVSACGLKKAEVNIWDAHCRALAVRERTPPVVETVPSRWHRVRTGGFRLFRRAFTRDMQMLLLCAAVAVWPWASSTVFHEAVTPSGAVRIMSIGTVSTVLSSTACRTILIRHRSRHSPTCDPT